jgi:hypothetical protein
MNFSTSDLRLNSRTSMSMGQELRTIGQGLESLDVEDFDLQGEGHDYFALGIRRGQAASAKAAQSGATGLRNTLLASWQNLTGQASSTRKLLEPGPGVLRILFTTEGILKLAAAGITRRSPSSVGVPDFTKLAQALRMVGERVDAEAARLLTVSKRGDRIAFAYAIAAGHRTEEWRLSQLYGRWLGTYQYRRSDITRSQAGH